jgi:membrane protease YdiL (CAAX protease family)
MLLWCLLFGIILGRIGPLSGKPLAKTLPTLIVYSLSASVLLASLEEVIFRWFLFDLCRRKFSLSLSMHGVALIFAGAHFTSARTDFETPGLILRGFYQAFYSCLDFFAQIQWVYFVNLYLFSYLLCCCVIKTKTLWSAIGLHGGCIFVLMILRSCYNFAPQVDQNFLYGTGRITDAAITWLCLLGLILWVRPRCNGVP